MPIQKQRLHRDIKPDNMVLQARLVYPCWFRDGQLFLWDMKKQLDVQAKSVVQPYSIVMVEYGSKEHDNDKESPRILTPRLPQTINSWLRFDTTYSFHLIQQPVQAKVKYLKDLLNVTLASLLRKIYLRV